MNLGQKKTLFQNALVLASADGQVDSLERDFLRRFLEAADVSESEAHAWLEEAKHQPVVLAPSPSRKEALEIMRFLSGMAAADGRIDMRERDALVAAGKILGLSHADLREIAREVWQSDAADSLFTEPVEKRARVPAASGPAPLGGETNASVLVVRDHFTDLARALDVNPTLSVDVRTLNRLHARAKAPTHILFHAVDEREKTLEIYDALKQVAPSARIISIVRRDQAFLISYLIERGAHRCVVEPVYPGELEKICAAHG